MSLILQTALAAAATAAPNLPHCSWDRPGHNPFMGGVVEAVDRYQDIPADTRTKLKERMRTRQYDELVLIKRDSIVGQQSYSAEIRDMHFGAGQICGTVTRAKWADSTEERGLVYCEGNHCILVPTVCRNVSRIARLPQRKADNYEGPGDAVAALPEPGFGNAFDFDPPAAGPLGAATPADSSFASVGGDPAAGAPVVVGDVPGMNPLIPGMGAFLGGLFGGGGGGGGYFGGGGGGGTGGGGGGGGGTGGGGGGESIPFTPPIPEPSTYALMLAGLALVATVARRRRSQ